MNKDIIVFNLDIANNLIRKGYKVKSIVPNRDNKGKVVVYFEWDIELVNTLRYEYNIYVR